MSQVAEMSEQQLQAHYKRYIARRNAYNFSALQYDQWKGYFLKFVAPNIASYRAAKIQGWHHALVPGDEVKWNDPNGGAGSKTVRIQSIETTEDAVKIVDDQGGCLEAPVWELG
jgi:hypothetical protein